MLLVSFTACDDENNGNNNTLDRPSTDPRPVFTIGNGHKTPSGVVVFLVAEDGEGAVELL